MSQKHGMHKTREYACWVEMRQRCSNPRRTSFKYYGGRGIRVCERWEKFENFFADMGLRPSTKHSIERIDNDRSYDPGNCKWATDIEQQNNVSRNRILEFRGERKTATQWARSVGIRETAIITRLFRGWSVERTLTTPLAWRGGWSKKKAA